LLLVLLLRRRGWDVVYLGANVPQARLETAVEQVKPRVVVLTAQYIHSAAKLQEMGFFLEQSWTRMAYGGLIFNRIPELRSRIPGEFLGERLDRAPQVLEAARSSRSFRHPDRSPPGRQVLPHRQNSGQSAVAGAQGYGIRHADPQTTNHFLAQGIVAR
jgi:hypothetical protein